jgi:hypothetical protein
MTRFSSYTAHHSGSSDTDVLQQIRTGLADTLTQLQRWLTETDTTRLLVTTHHGVATSPDDPINLTAAAITGLVRTAQTENPDRIRLLDTDNHDHLGEAWASPEPHLAVRDGILYQPRLTPTTPSGASQPIDPDGTTLITGGTGTLGQHLARHLATTGQARHLLLASRTGPHHPDASTLHDTLTALGATVTITACDTADPHQLTALLNNIPADHPLTAVIHTAGTLDDHTIPNLTPNTSTPPSPRRSTPPGTSTSRPNTSTSPPSPPTPASPAPSAAQDKATTPPPTPPSTPSPTTGTPSDCPPPASPGDCGPTRAP